MGKVMDNRYSRKYIGEEFKTREGYTAIVIDGGNKCGYCVIEIDPKDTPKQIKEVTVYSLKAGTVKYAYHRTVAGIGYLGDGPFSTLDSRAYRTWTRLIVSTNSPIGEHRHKKLTINKDWLNFQNFCKWFVKHDIGDKVFSVMLIPDGSTVGPNMPLFIPNKAVLIMKHVSNNATGHTGICKHRKYGRYIVQITLDNGKPKHIGSFKNMEDAIAAYRTHYVNIVKTFINELKDMWSNELTSPLTKTHYRNGIKMLEDKITYKG